jgi:hypothetical protein
MLPTQINLNIPATKEKMVTMQKDDRKRQFCIRLHEWCEETCTKCQVMEKYNISRQEHDSAF